MLTSKQVILWIVNFCRLQVSIISAYFIMATKEIHGENPTPNDEEQLRKMLDATVIKEPAGKVIMSNTSNVT